MNALRDRFPRTLAELRALPDGERALAHLVELDRGFGVREAGVAIADDGGPTAGAMDVDVALAGGGLSLLYAAYLARAGFKVAVFDRGRIGRGHREWNISRAELRPLVASGLLSEDELAALVLYEYEGGIVRWHGGKTYRVRHVLDCVIDAQGLLDRLRALASSAGALLLDGHRLTGYRVGRGGVALDLASDGAAGGTRATLTARLLLDGTGALSPHARFDLVCPTVGGVLAGLEEGTADDQLDPRVGEILVSTEGVEEDRQHIWEGFPAPRGTPLAALERNGSPAPRGTPLAALERNGSPALRGTGRGTIYLFYYAEPDTLGPNPLFALYERFFRLRPRYKRGLAALEKATYGYIPAHTRLRRLPTAPSDRVLLVGDAAGRHSPLTFCGFGSMVRSFRPVGDGVRALLESDRLSARSLAAVWREPPALRLVGALALMMVPRGGRGALGPPRGDGPTQPPDEINQLLDTAFGALASLGEDVFAAMVRDEIGFRDFLRFMQVTSRRRPSIYREVFQQLTPAEIATWSLHFSALAAKSLAGRA